MLVRLVPEFDSRTGGERFERHLGDAGLVKEELAPILPADEAEGACQFQSVDDSPRTLPPPRSYSQGKSRPPFMLVAAVTASRTVTGLTRRGRVAYLTHGLCILMVK